MSGYRPRGSAAKYPDKQLSAAQAKAQLMALLYTCRPERLAQLTIDSLASMYRVNRREIEYELTIARQKEAEGKR